MKVQLSIFALALLASQAKHVSADGGLRNLEETLPELVFVGDGKHKRHSLGECEGDCDRDKHCELGLVCFQRGKRNKKVPGCSGIPPTDSTDYCVKPKENQLVLMGNNGSPSNAFPLQACQGDCDNDSDCAGSLKCFQRDGTEEVPGCIGKGQRGNDYCYDDTPATVAPTITPTPAPCLSWCSTNTNPWSTKCTWKNCKGCDACDDPAEPTPAPTSSPTASPISDNTLVIAGDNGSPSSAFPLGKCEGDCDGDSDCSGNLKCFQRSGTEAVPGCEGSGVSAKDYCFEVPSNYLWWFGNDGQPETAFPLGLCQGDCDNDDECQEGLVCMQRSGDEAVPGCDGAGETGTDYCVAAPTPSPTFTRSPTRAPVEGLTYVPGEATVYENGLVLSTGLTSRIIATKNTKVQYHNGGQSSENFHSAPDGAAVFKKPGSCEWAYVSNSESSSNGGVGAIYFDCEGRVTEFKSLLTGTSRNCGGGKTFWGTWLTCEEHDNGQIWEVDPWGDTGSRQTVMGGAGMDYESAAYDNRDPSNPKLYATVDTSIGPLVKYSPPTSAVQDAVNTGDYSNLLHANGPGQKFEYLNILTLDETTGLGTYEWTESLQDGEISAGNHHPSGEGIDIRDGKLYYTTKARKHLFIIDLDDGTFVRSSTQSGAFDAQPDQVARILDTEDVNDILYFCEDGTNDAGIHGRNPQGEFFTILKDADGFYGGETTGLSFSPDAMFMYVSYQVPGHIFEFRRTDGLPFSGQVLDIKYHEDDTGGDIFVRHLNAENEKTCELVYETC